MDGPLQRPAPESGTKRIHEVVGAPRRPTRWSETTPPRSWAELAETLHGGLAVLDDWRLSYISDRFLHGIPGSDTLGLDFRRLVPALAEGDPRDLGQLVDRGVRVEFEQQFLTAQHELRWFRITVLPLSEPGDTPSAIVFAKDITPTSRALAQLRDATLALTEIENGLRQRLSREIHDGPIQLLAALAIRLGLADQCDATGQLQAVVSSVATEMRSAVASFSQLGEQVAPALLLRQWITPCLAGSEIEIEIHDQRSANSELSEIQAVFVFLYQAVRAARYVGRRRRICLTLLDENDGIRILITINSSSKDALEIGRVAAQYRAAVDHARALGGTLSNSIDGAGTRLLSMWIPTDGPSPERRQVAPTEEESRPVPSGREADTHHADATTLRSLDDATWQAIAMAAPERLVEHDAFGRFTFVNDVQQDMLGHTSDDLVGRTMFSVFSEAAMADLRPSFERLLIGEVIDVQWLRNNAFGEYRLVRVTTSPRLDDRGELVGTLSAVDDLSDVHFLNDLYESALADLTLSRRLVTERTLQRLRPAVDACAHLVGQLADLAQPMADPDAFRSIGFELDRALDNVRRSVNSLESPDLSISDLGDAVRGAVELVVTGTEIQFTDNTSATPSPENLAAFFRIAREAVVNAVSHGGAQRITIRLRDDSDGLALDIHDDGSGIEPGDLEEAPGHLGTRSMRERAHERGGRCRIEPDPRGGTIVRVWLPHDVGRASTGHSPLLPT